MLRLPSWIRPLENSGVPKNVKVWQIGCDSPDIPLHELPSLLLGDEIERWNKFLVESARQRYLIARSALRLILSAVLEIPTDALRFGYGPNGKPYLKKSKSEAILHFNVAHSGNLVLVAASLSAEVVVGVDIEEVIDRPDAYEAAIRFLSPPEVRILTQASPNRRPNLFYRIWTRKEALLKGIGTGISAGLDSTDVSEEIEKENGRQPIIVRADGTWSIYDLRPSPGYLGALALAGNAI